MRALKEYQHKLLENNVSIFVRRGGPNYQEGLRAMREVGSKLSLKMYVFGPETHMTAIVGMALGTRPIPKSGLIEKSTSSASMMGIKSVSVYIGMIGYIATVYICIYNYTHTIRAYIHVIDIIAHSIIGLSFIFYLFH